jgi:hypothetical protein
MRKRFRVVLVDEFQDTDPVQWRIMRRAFAEGDGTLVLIGDPKQAIYAFRGADVYAYLDAAASAGARATLGVNWRSDQPLLDAYDALFAGSRLGHEGIVYRTVRAAPPNVHARLHGARVTSPATSRPISSGCCPRRPRSSRATARDRHAASRSRPVTSPCSCARTRRRRSCATPCTRPGSRRSSAARAASSGRPRPASGSTCSRRSSGRRPVRARAPPR